MLPSSNSPKARHAHSRSATEGIRHSLGSGGQDDRRRLKHKKHISLGDSFDARREDYTRRLDQFMQRLQQKPSTNSFDQADSHISGAVAGKRSDAYATFKYYKNLELFKNACEHVDLLSLKRRVKMPIKYEPEQLYRVALLKKVLVFNRDYELRLRGEQDRWHWICVDSIAPWEKQSVGFQQVNEQYVAQLQTIRKQMAGLRNQLDQVELSIEKVCTTFVPCHVTRVNFCFNP
jgi:hypothetical protein